MNNMRKAELIYDHIPPPLLPFSSHQVTHMTWLIKTTEASLLVYMQLHPLARHRCLYPLYLCFFSLGTVQWQQQLHTVLYWCIHTIVYVVVYTALETRLGLTGRGLRLIQFERLIHSLPLLVFHSRPGGRKNKIKWKLRGAVSGRVLANISSKGITFGMIYNSISMFSNDSSPAKTYRMYTAGYNLSAYKVNGWASQPASATENWDTMTSSSHYHHHYYKRKVWM